MNLDSFTGQGADNVKQYMYEVHGLCIGGNVDDFYSVNSTFYLLSLRYDKA